jgi:hypothetical protein
MPSKDAAQKRAATLKEAKSLKASGGELRPEHTVALERESRRLEGQKSRYSEAKTAIASGKDVAPTLKAAASKVAKVNPTLVEKAQRYKMSTPTVEQALSSVIKDSRYTDSLADRPRQVKQNPINNDNSHHAVLATIADSMSDKLNDAESKGSLNPGVANKAAGHLADAYSYHDISLQHHNAGDAENAKKNMHYSAESLVRAHAELHARRGISLAPGISNLISATASKYANSTTPGIGAKPHEDFTPNRVLKERSTLEPKSVEKKAAPAVAPRLLSKEQLGQAISEYTSAVPENPRNITTPASPRKRAEMRYAKGVEMNLKGMKPPRSESLASKKEKLEQPELSTGENTLGTQFSPKHIADMHVQYFMEGRHG